MSTRVRRVAAGMVAAGYAVTAIVILHSGVGDGEYGTASEYVVGYVFAGVLVSLAVAVGVFRDRSRAGVTLVVAGCLVLTLGVMWGNVTGHDPSWFAVFGVPGNVAILAGSAVIARHVWREGRVGRMLAVLLLAYVPAGLVGAEVGGGLLAAVPWALVAAGVIAGRPRQSPAAREDGLAAPVPSG